MSEKTKCPCYIGGLAALQELLEKQKPNKTILIEDTGKGWRITTFGPECYGLGSEHVTIQSALDDAEQQMAALRRQPDTYTPGHVITDPEEIAEALSKGL